MQPDSIVVAGGQARRLGGIDKPMLPLGSSGNALLVDVIDACPGRVIVIGPKRVIDRDVMWLSDHVADGGPGVGLWTGLSQVTSDYVFITAADQRLDATDVARICAAAIGRDGAWAIRADGTGQPLCACVSSAVLRELLEPSLGVGVSPLRLLSTRDMVGVTVSDVRDVDTWQDVAELVHDQGALMTQMWLQQVANALGVDVDVVPENDVLELTRDVAHGVERKAAPLTTFLIGYAAASSDRDINELLAIVRSALNDWVPADQVSSD
ncbi:MAG: DUF6457 domain-containing protein [Actinomycetes bacterium]